MLSKISIYTEITKLIYLHLSTDCFLTISLQSTGPTGLQVSIYTKILEVNLFALAYRLQFHEDFLLNQINKKVHWTDAFDIFYL